jgi:alpha-L-rhamnosidase
MPSWLYPITKGATTVWEKWDAIKPDGSFDTCSLNHYAYGAVGDWLYEEVAGIQAAAPGYKKIIIKPHMGARLTWVKASYSSVHGMIRSSWKIAGDQIVMDVVIPRGATAIIFIPAGTGYITKRVGPGSYHFIGKK